MERKSRKTRIGIVASDKMDRVESRTRHPLYGKITTSSKKYKAHDENNEARVGDKVLITETRPLSREKRWRVVEILEKAPIV